MFSGNYLCIDSGLFGVSHVLRNDFDADLVTVEITDCCVLNGIMPNGVSIVRNQRTTRTLSHVTHKGKDQMNY